MSRLEIWISGWVDIACGIAKVLTFGFYIPTWAMSWALYCTRKAILADRAKRGGGSE